MEIYMQYTKYMVRTKLPLLMSPFFHKSTRLTFDCWKTRRQEECGRSQLNISASSDKHGHDKWCECTHKLHRLLGFSPLSVYNRWNRPFHLPIQNVRITGMYFVTLKTRRIFWKSVCSKMHARLLEIFIMDV